jgi:hypothetical protein
MIGLFLVSEQTRSETIIIPVTYRGYVQSNGSSPGGASGGNNFLVIPGSYNNWFGFSLGSQTAASISSAKLYLFNTSSSLSGYNGVAGSGTYTIWDVSSSTKSLLNSGTTTAGTSAFSDLGGGTAYGSVSYSTADNGKYMVIDLNSTGLADLQSAYGSGFFNVGGSAAGTGNVFAYSGGFVNQNQTYLEVISVPEPSALSLLAVGLGGLALVRRRRS